MTSSTEVKHFEKQLNNALSMSGFGKVMNEEDAFAFYGRTNNARSINGQEQKLAMQSNF